MSKLLAEKNDVLTPFLFCNISFFEAMFSLRRFFYFIVYSWMREMNYIFL